MNLSIVNPVKGIAHLLGFFPALRFDAERKVTDGGENGMRASRSTVDLRASTGEAPRRGVGQQAPGAAP